MALKKSDLYSSLWASCDQLRGGMDASQYKDYVLFMLFIKYITDKYGNSADFAPPVTIPKGASFKDMLELRGKSDIGDKINTQVIAPLVDANARLSRTDFPDFNDSNKLGEGKEKVDNLTSLINIFASPALDFSQIRAEHDDILGDAYEYLMRHFATEPERSLWLRRARWWERLSEHKCFFGWALGTKELKPFNCLRDSRAMPLAHPPEDHISLSHALEPFLAALHDLDVRRPVDVFVQRLDVLPNGHVDQRVVAHRTHCRCVTFLGLQAPNISGRAFGKRINPIEVRNEVDHVRRLKRFLHDCDVQLGEFVGGHADSFRRNDEDSVWRRATGSLPPNKALQRTGPRPAAELGR